MFGKKKTRGTSRVENTKDSEAGDEADQALPATLGDRTGDKRSLQGADDPTFSQEEEEEEGVVGDGKRGKRGKGGKGGKGKSGGAKGKNGRNRANKGGKKGKRKGKNGGEANDKDVEN